MRDNFLKNNPRIIIVSKLVNRINFRVYDLVLFVENVEGFSGYWKRARKKETKGNNKLLCEVN